jgi:hypothetical protein
MSGRALNWICTDPTARVSDFLETVTEPVKGVDHIKGIVDRPELFAQPFDVSVDRAIIDIDVLIVGGIHQRIAALDHARAARQRLQDQELSDGQRYIGILPGADVPLGIDAQQPALQHFGIDFLALAAVRCLRSHAAQHYLDALDQEPLRERFADEIVRAHVKAEQFVDLLVLGGEKDYRHV